MAAILPCQAASPKQLSPNSFKAQIQQLEKRLRDADLRNAQQQDLSHLKKLMSDFAVSEITAYPWMSAEQLRQQFTYIYSCEECETPYVFVNGDWGPRTKTRTWAIVYWVWFGSYESDGSATVIDSYVWQEGNVRLAGQGGSEMTGTTLEANQIFNPTANSLSVLVNGVTPGSSGRTIDSRAVLYGVGPDGVHAVWRTSHLGSLSVGAQNDTFELFYQDDDRVYHNPPLPDPFVVEVYTIDTAGAIPRRIVKQHYGER